MLSIFEGKLASIPERMRTLDEDYELGSSRTLISHLFDTIRVLGGLQGLLLIAVAAAMFYGYVLYTIRTGREKRMRKRE